MMSPEQYSSPSSAIDTVVYQELFSSPDLARDIQKLIRRIDLQAQQPGSIDEEALSEALGEIDELIGLADYQEEVPAKYTGFLYPNDEHGGAVAEGVAVYDDDVQFSGSRYTETDDGPRVVFALEWDDGDGRREYTTSLEDMLRLELAHESLASVLQRHALSAEITASSETFLQASRHYQTAALQTLTHECLDDIERFADEQQQISLAGEAFIRYDEASHQPFAVESYEPDNQYVSGTLSDVVYLELGAGQKRTIRNFEEFMYGGMPCVKLRCSDLRATVYLPIGGIVGYQPPA